MKKGLKWTVIIIIVLVVTFLVGPKPDKLALSAMVEGQIVMDIAETTDVPGWVQWSLKDKKVRPGNESKLFWADSVNRPTKYVLLYLHGFSASPEEGAPIHLDFAKKHGMNMYAPVLYGHGLVEDEPMIDFTGEGYINSAKEALEVAKLMGDSVIIMATSTGCTAALFLASEPSNGVHSLLCYSPNIRVFDPRASLLTGPWGLQISRLVKGGNYNIWEAPAGAGDYWHLKYRLEAVVEMQRLLEGTMTKETFENVACPTFIGYYYKNEKEQDDVVSVPRILEMYDQLGSRAKRKVALPNVGKHALASRFFSSDLESVERETSLFTREVLGIYPTSTIGD
jgi:esterase/lipase